MYIGREDYLLGQIDLMRKLLGLKGMSYEYRPIEFTEDEFQELKQMTSIMRSYKGFDNDLDQTIEQETLKKIKCPTLILHSENDNAVDMSHAQNAKNNIKHSKLATFNNHWGHLLWLGTDYNPILNELKHQID